MMDQFSPLIFVLLVAVLVIVFVVGSAAALLRWRGGWRWVAGLPLLGVIAIVAKIFADIGADPTAHNLWPFEVLGAVAVAGAVLIGIQLIRLAAQRWVGRAEKT
jgi:hypothetical protein